MMTVSLSEQALAFCQRSPIADLQIFIEKVLKQDPRPPYKKQRQDTQSYGMNLYNFNIKVIEMNLLLLKKDVKKDKIDLGFQRPGFFQNCGTP